jgi:DNA helicase-2/ATP-dependent DNA helicase PcrA
VAIFYRTNAQSAALEEAMVHAEVPYKVVGGTKFYDRREVKDVMAYLKVLVNPDDEVSWRRIVNVPKRGVGETSVAKLAGWAGTRGLSFGDAVAHADEVGHRRKGGHALAGLSGGCWTAASPRWPCPPWSTRTARPSPPGFPATTTPTRPGPRRVAVGSARARGAGHRGVEGTGYRSELLSEGTIEALGRVENVDTLVGMAAEYRTLAEFLEAASLVADSDELEGDGTKVSLMTMHIAKGLEFPAVFLVGMEDGIFPHLRSLGDPVELEEERRLCYVGITRAERHLYVSHAWSRMLYGRGRPATSPAGS